MEKDIVIKGARENNLQNLDVTIPREKIVAFAGVSGSGKSSLVFDTIAITSNHQLYDIFPLHIRNRMPYQQAPKVDSVENLSTAVVVDQRPFSGNIRSSVGTMTEVSPLLRLLFSRFAANKLPVSGAYSFNDPQGMCPCCHGLGSILCFDMDKMIDKEKSLNQEAIRLPGFAVDSYQWQTYANSGLFDNDKPLKEYTEKEWDDLLHGSGFTVDIKNNTGKVWEDSYKLTYEGLLDRMERLHLKKAGNNPGKTTQKILKEFTTQKVCPACHGKRLKEEALASTFLGYSIWEMGQMEVSDLLQVFQSYDGRPGRELVDKISNGLQDIVHMGLGYLNLNRPSNTLSGGETQRLKIVRHLRSSLIGMTYIFDEPSVGLHPKDIDRLNKLMIRLKNQGNTVLLVEHDKNPLYVDHADGSRLYDVEGNSYIDYHGGSGAAMFGHNHPRIKEAVMKSVERGFFMNYDTEDTIKLAQLTRKLFPSCEKIRLANTGSEATQGAIRLARGYTGKELVLRFDGHFHGMHEEVWFNHSKVNKMEESGQVETVPDSAGFPSDAKDSVINVRFNDVEALEAVIKKYKDQIACLIMEPVSFNCGCLVPKKDFIKAVRDICTREGIVLIFDEVICGLRMRPGSAQRYFDVYPDLTTTAKAIGGGLPIALIGGKAEIMDHFSPFGEVVMSGTYTGSLMPVMAAVACMEMALEPGFYDHFDNLGEKLFTGFDDLFKKHNMPGHVRGIGARWAIYFGVEDPQDDYDFRVIAEKFDRETDRKFVTKAVENGLWFHDTSSNITPAHRALTTAHTIFRTAGKVQTSKENRWNWCSCRSVAEGYGKKPADYGGNFRACRSCQCCRGSRWSRCGRIGNFDST